MQTEKIKMSEKQEQQITDMLHSQGLTQSEIDEILKGEYSTFKTDDELTKLFSLDGNYQNVLRGLADGYSINELQQIGINSAEIEAFNEALQKYNLQWKMQKQLINIVMTVI